MKNRVEQGCSTAALKIGKQGVCLPCGPPSRRAASQPSTAASMSRWSLCCPAATPPLPGAARARRALSDASYERWGVQRAVLQSFSTALAGWMPMQVPVGTS